MLSIDSQIDESSALFLPGVYPQVGELGKRAEKLLLSLSLQDSVILVMGVGGGHGVEKS